MFLKISQISQDNTCVREPVFNNFIKNGLHQRCFPVKFSKFLRRPILKNTCERLLLNRKSVLQKLLFSTLINVVMKYSFPAAVVQGRRALYANLPKIALHHRYFSKNLTTSAEQRYRIFFWKHFCMTASQRQLQKYIHFRNYRYFTFLTLTSC